MNINYENVEIIINDNGKWSAYYEGESLVDPETKKPVYKGIPVLFTNVPDDAKNWFKDNSFEAHENNQTDDDADDENSSFIPKTNQVSDASNQTNKPEKSTGNKTKELRENVDKLKAELEKIEADEKAELKAVRDRFRKKKNNKKADIEKAENVFRKYVFANNPEIKSQVDKLLNG